MDKFVVEFTFFYNEASTVASPGETADRYCFWLRVFLTMFLTLSVCFFVSNIMHKCYLTETDRIDGKRL